MLTFNYKAATIDGNTVSGVLCGNSRSDIAGQLHALGHTPIHIDETEVRAEGKRTRLLSRLRINDVQVADFTRDLGTLLRAGIGLDHALSILGTLAEDQELGEVLGQIQERVKGGATLADAVEEHGTIFNLLYVNILRAGESGGALEVVLERLAEHLARNKEMRDALVSALVYPAILIVVAVVSVFILLGYVVPQFTDMFASAGEALPTSTRITIAVGEALQSYGWLPVLMAATAVVIIRQQSENSARLKRWHNWLLKLPVAGAIILKIEIARFSRTLATLLQNGVTLLKALSIAKDTMSNKGLANGVEQVTVSLKEGQSLAAPLAKHTRFPPFAIHMISVGEETGNLQDILLQVADAYDRETQTTIKRALALLEPALILILGGIIAAVIISILVAILSVNELVI